MRKIILFFILVTTVVGAWADGKISFTANAPEVVVSGDQFRLTYTVNSQKVRDFRAPSMKDFEVLMGPSRSTQSSTQIINGNVTSTSTITFTYILMAGKEGTYNIPAATIVAEGNNYTSNSVTVKVLPTDQSSGASSGNSGRNSRNQASNGAITEKELFMMASASKTKVYEQEAILLTYKVYTQVNLTELRGDIPDLKDFHTQEVELPQQKTFTLEHYNGRNYNTTIWRQLVLFPQKTGKIEIPSVTFEGTVSQMVASADPFDAFFNGGNYVNIKKNLVAPKLIIDVKELPEGKPANFSGGVGEFTISSSISTQELKTNDAVTIKLVISGTGNMKLINTPEVKFPQDFEIYDPKVENKFSLNKNGFSGNKVIEYLAIPRFGGEFTVPAIKFSYYDIASKQYKILTTESYTLKVEKGRNDDNATVAAYVSKEELKLLGQDIRYIKRGDTKYEKSGSHLFASGAYYAWYIIPLLLFAGYIMLHYKAMAENANMAAMRTKKANKVAVKRLKVAKNLLKENKKNEFYDEILKTVWGYMSDKLNIPVSQLSKDNITTELEKKRVEQELVTELHNLLNECEFARYAPGDASAAMDNVYKMAIAVISNMENSIKR